MPAAGDRPRKLVVAALVRQAEQVLMSQRRADESCRCLWEFPGGKVEPGEAPRGGAGPRDPRGAGLHAVGRIHEVVFHAYEAFDQACWSTASELDAEARGPEVAAAAWVGPSASDPEPATRRLPARARARGSAGNSEGASDSPRRADASGPTAAAWSAGKPRGRRSGSRGPGARPAAGLALGGVGLDGLGMAQRLRSAAGRLGRVALAGATQAGVAQLPRWVCSWLSGGQ